MNNLMKLSMVVRASILMAMFTSGVLIASAKASAKASATADPISVDARIALFSRVVSSADLSYSPDWQSEAAGSGRSTRIDVVTDPDTASATTNTLVTGIAGVESEYAWAPNAASAPYCRLLHWTLDGGVPTGAPLACDVVIAKVSLPGTAFDVDTRTNSLQKVVDANGIAALTCSPIWTFDGNSVLLQQLVKREGSDSIATNLLFQSGSPAELEYALQICSVPTGHCILQHLTLNASSQVIGDILMAEFIIDRPTGIIMVLR